MPTSILGTALGAVLAGTLFEADGQDPCAVAVVPCFPFLNYVCRPEHYWSFPVDLDGDDIPEFNHARFDVWNFCDFDLGGGEEARDNREGFFAAEHVEVYAIRDWAVQTFISPELAPGRTILPNPPVGGDDWDRLWAFNPPFSLPYLQAYGLGYVARRTNRVPCYEQPWACQGGGLFGLLARAFDARTYVALTGFRVRQADGWHLGWLKLEMTPMTEPGNPPPPRVLLRAWAIHPEPEQPIRAGEPPQPTLRAQRAGDTVTIAWHAAWTGWRLERRRELGAGTWEPVPDVTGNTHSFPVADAPWLFRLVK
ncbi:MAG: hypothetical protein IPM17_07575 [Verrucomicrobia bacterium]|nr:hypothetical protein [Verrucomicrobiota bacterium]